MANKRMFSMDVIDTDTFLDMPPSSQNLYFHLGLRADDDGFVSSPNRIAKLVNATGDDLKILLAKNFIIQFQTGVIVITDWNCNNAIRKDRYRATRYIEEKSQLVILENGSYVLKDNEIVYNLNNDNQVTTTCQPDDNQTVTKCQPAGIPNDNQWLPQVRLVKDRLGKVSIDKSSSSSSGYNFNKLITIKIEETFGRMTTPYEVETLMSYHQDGLELELIIRALEISVENNAKNIAYTKSILNRCLVEKIYTLKNFELKQKERENRNGTNKQGVKEIERTPAELVQLNYKANINEPDEPLPF